MAGITKLERKVLLAIVNNEYQDSNDEYCINNPVWVFSVSYDVGGTKIFSGVMSSLRKKKLAGMSGKIKGDGATCWITKKGFEAIKMTSHPEKRGRR